MQLNDIKVKVTNGVVTEVNLCKEAYEEMTYQIPKSSVK